VGAADRPALDALAARLVADVGLAPIVAARLVARHGTQASDVVVLGQQLGLLDPLAAGEDMIEAEVAWAARHELALSLDDVLSRRMRLAQELPDRGAEIAARVAAILGAELGWDEARQAGEVGDYLASAGREFAIA
jgi:glycerol-3-phosphate dehydrogenase